MTGHGNQLVTAKNVFDQSQSEFKSLFDHQIALNIEKFAQVDSRLFSSANLIDALKIDSVKQADFIKVNREGLKEIMSQLDEIDLEIDLNTDK